MKLLEIIEMMAETAHSNKTRPPNLGFSAERLSIALDELNFAFAEIKEIRKILQHSEKQETKEKKEITNYDEKHY